MRIKRLIPALAICAGLAACGDTPAEQALYGGSAGVLGSLVLNTDPVVGAAAGAAGNLLYCQTQNNCD
ncbi:hypothetical protein FGK63_10425 [Ruegeria sediminis]|uniref:Lipoprotein n=1 Tax=Ruegeria sediminis TaxID=2583820 RepID=A0ABY2WZX1_9RHOB|nr:hypothetical protein [Ruegeria sediminis]TMV07865.1 hypothetical protein FGK63_10425 [Ruegeria sediminis]